MLTHQESPVLESHQGLLHLASLIAGHLPHFKNTTETDNGGATFHLNRATYRLAYDLVPALHSTQIDSLLDDFLAHHEPDELIQHAGAPYLERWFLAPRDQAEQRTYLHRFLTDDPISEGFHDHPWDSASLLLRGNLHEHWRTSGTADDENLTHIAPAILTLRAAEITHRITIGAEPPITLFVTGPHLRQWGFWRRDERGYPVWRDSRDIA